MEFVSNGFLSAEDEYAEATALLLEHQEAILLELQSLLQDHQGDGRKWGVWAAEDYDPPKFTLLTPEEILQRQQTVVEDPERQQQWSLFGLHLYCEPIARGCVRCPNTAAVLAKIPGLINAGFSCLGPQSQTGWHDDVDRGFDRLHLPLIIPEGDCGFTVGSGTQHWKNGSMLAFDDTIHHNAWNFTDSARYILLVDVERNSRRAAEMEARQSSQPDQHVAVVSKRRTIDQNFFSWHDTLPCLKLIVQQLDVVQKEWKDIINSPKTIESPELTYDKDTQTWKNFWLVHTFPADRPELTTWIESNCQLVPKTAALLRQIPGVRDAFFSELGPGVVLDEHYGYADQSNFVLRCHIPLVVPTYMPENGTEVRPPCYVEVEGERQYHTLGEAIVFDDSKLHSAGNLSNDQCRTVLIVDIDRPCDVKFGTSGSCISRSMLSHWCSKVYPHFNDKEVVAMVEERITFCKNFLEEEY